MKNSPDQIPTVMPVGNRPINLGQSINDDTSRLDAIAKVTGSAKFGRDMYLPNSLFVGFVRCPFGVGTLESYDDKPALAIPDVLEVNIDGKQGRYHGHPVGYVVAESPLALRRGLRAVKVKWQRDRAKTLITDTADGPPDATEETQELLKQADHVVEATYSMPVQTHSASETHGAVVDHRGDSAVVYSSTQGTFSAADGLEESLGLPRSKYEIRCEYVGGGFGAKLRPGKEGQTASKVSAKYKRPAYLFVDRAEEHLDTGNRPSSRTYAKLGFNNDGTVIGGQIHTWGGVGVGGRGGGVVFPSGRYELGDIQKSGEVVELNGGAPRAFRAPGRPQGAFAEELILDEIATAAGLDPVKLRIRLDKDEDRREMYILGSRLIGWQQRQQTGKQQGVIRHGFGAGSSSWGRFHSHTEAQVVINPDGSVEVLTGTQDIGQGQRTVMAVVAAEQLGIPLHIIQVKIGQSSLPIGPASGGSMTAHNTAPAMADAARDVKVKFLTMLAEQAGADASELDIANGAILRNGKAFMQWNDACRKIRGAKIVGQGEWSQQTRRNDTSTGHSNGVQFANVEVDTETGVIRVKHIVAIQACGRVIARKLAESQIIGGVIQGLSYALFENKLLDRQTGTMVNPNLEAYKIAGAGDIPHIEPILWTKGQTGVRSLGEPPTIPTAGAIACAVYNAIGTPVRHSPLTPDKVLAALEGGSA